MELTLHKCKVLIPGLSQDAANHAIRSVISAHPELSSLSDMVSDDALARIIVGDRAMSIADVMKIDGFICVGVPCDWHTLIRGGLGEREEQGTDQGFAESKIDV